MNELSLITLFCHIDDFCKEFETKCNQNLIEHDTQSKHWWTTRESKLCDSELITLAIVFHNSNFGFIDSTILSVCHVCRASGHRVFKKMAKKGKTTGWFYGLKLHHVINHKGEILSWMFSLGNVDDRSPVPALTNGLWGKLFGDRGYISKKLFEQLHE